MIQEHDQAAYHARYNSNLHCLMATRCRRFDLGASLVAALTATSSAVASYSDKLGDTWHVLLLVAAVSSILRPVLRWSEEYARHHSLALAYQQLEWRLASMDMPSIQAEFAKLASLEATAQPFLWGWMEKQADSKTRDQLRYAPV